MEKLVRDKISEFSRLADDGRRFRTAEASEMPYFLAKKVIEEAQEVAEELYVEPVPNYLRVLEELADLQEAMNAVMQYFGMTPEGLKETMRQKAETKGTFSRRIVLDLDSNLPKFAKTDLDK